MDTAKLKLVIGALLVFSVAIVVGVVVAVAGSSGNDNDSLAVATATAPSRSAGQTPPSDETAVATDTATAVSPTASSGAAPAPTQPLSPTEAPGLSVEPNGERILEQVKQFSDVIGPRPAGTQLEKAAADLIADRLSGFGYDVTLQEFSIATATSRSAVLGVLTPEARTVATFPLVNSATASVTGRVVTAGIGEAGQFPDDVDGAIVLIERGELFFNDKVANAVEAGAAGVIIYNNEPGIFYGSLSNQASVPVVAISKAEGDALVDDLAAGEVTVELSVDSLTGETSYNVIAKPPGQDCETVTGGHYDSVQQAPGASDNATGTATVLEIAFILSQNGEAGSNCFVLFGGEELGLLGSQFYVSSLSAEERDAIKAMLNFDMVGVGEEAWWFIGTAELQQRMAALAEDLGVRDGRASTLSGGLSSDHASFLQAGIPALMFHRWEDPLLHTPQDVSSRVNPDYLEQAARMGVALLESLSAGG